MPQTERKNDVTAAGLAAFSWTLRLAPFAALVYLFQRVAARAGKDWRWPAAASILLALLAAAFTVNYELPTAELNSGQLMLGFGVALTVVQATQFVVPVAIAAWLFRRNGVADAKGRLDLNGAISQ